MQKIILPFLAFVVALAFANKPSVQTQNAPPASPHLPRGTATDVSGAEIQSLVQKTAADRVSDQAIRVVSINGEYNVGLGVVHRAKTSGAQAGGGIEHSRITEIYHVIEGNATRSEEHTSELQSRLHLVCRLLLEKKKRQSDNYHLIYATDRTAV